MTQPTPLPPSISALAANTPNSVLLETSRFDADNHCSYLFLHPLRILAAHTPEEIPTLFHQIEQALAENLYLTGFLTYESGYSLQGITDDTTQHDLPLACFGVYREPIVFDHNTGLFSGPPMLPLPQPHSTQCEPAFSDDEIALNLAPEDYRHKIEQIKERIAAGATYQVNFTDRIRLRTDVSPAELYLALRRQQPVAYGALVNLAGRSILSLSPELFFRVRDRKIVTRPMKGTWPRGLDAAEDALAALALHHDEKNRSEHIMIVNLLRNDLGRICSTGSIRVERPLLGRALPHAAADDIDGPRHAAQRDWLARTLPQPLSQRLHHRRAQDQHHAHHSQSGGFAARHLHRGHRLHRAHGRRLLQRRHPHVSRR